MDLLDIFEYLPLFLQPELIWWWCVWEYVCMYVYAVGVEGNVSCFHSCCMRTLPIPHLQHTYVMKLLHKYFDFSSRCSCCYFLLLFFEFWLLAISLCCFCWQFLLKFHLRCSISRWHLLFIFLHSCVIILWKYFHSISSHSLSLLALSLSPTHSLLARCYFVLFNWM